MSDFIQTLLGLVFNVRGMERLQKVHDWKRRSLGKELRDRNLVSSRGKKTVKKIFRRTQ